MHSRVPNHAPVLDADLFVGLEDLADLLHALIEGCLGTSQHMSNASQLSKAELPTGRQQHQLAWPSAC